MDPEVNQDAKRKASFRKSFAAFSRKSVSLEKTSFSAELLSDKKSGNEANVIDNYFSDSEIQIKDNLFDTEKKVLAKVIPS
jgi:hypothetical protein